FLKTKFYFTGNFVLFDPTFSEARAKRAPKLTRGGFGKSSSNFVVKRAHMESEALLHHREGKLKRFQLLAATPGGRAQLVTQRERLRMLVRQVEGPPDNLLDAQLCALDGGTSAWDLAVIVEVLEPYETG
ncbi:hypothetical protein HY950_03910, partial [Candidatus Gottesmanbacteria bacterium]|nr:hypothetical protein [Candidatus Gottesmanbacteria bacterium]